MNLFKPFRNHGNSVEFLADKHVVKMTLETAQLLSTAFRVVFPENNSIGHLLYKSTHVSHPITLWVGESWGNLYDTAVYGLAIASEYEHRFGKEHASLRVIQHIIEEIEVEFGEAFVRSVGSYNFMTSQQPYCGPDEFKDVTIQASYTRYLFDKYMKWGPKAKWTKRKSPLE